MFYGNLSIYSSIRSRQKGSSAKHYHPCISQPLLQLSLLFSYTLTDFGDFWQNIQTKPSLQTKRNLSAHEISVVVWRNSIILTHLRCISVLSFLLPPRHSFYTSEPSLFIALNHKYPHTVFCTYIHKNTLEQNVYRLTLEKNNFLRIYYFSRYICY